MRGRHDLVLDGLWTSAKVIIGYNANRRAKKAQKKNGIRDIIRCSFPFNFGKIET